MLAFYYQVIPISEPRLRTALHLVSGYIVVAGLTTLLLDIFWCGIDPSVNWSVNFGLCVKDGVLLTCGCDDKVTSARCLPICAVNVPLYHNLDTELLLRDS
jgi:hypothetical protein